DPDHQDQTRPLGGDAGQARMDGGRASGAGVLDAGRALEAQGGFALHDERGREFLALEAGVDLPDEDLVDVGGGDAGVAQGRADPPADQRLRIGALVLAEGCVAPADDAGGHGGDSLRMDCPDDTGCGCLYANGLATGEILRDSAKRPYGSKNRRVISTG